VRVPTRTMVYSPEMRRFAFLAAIPAVLLTMVAPAGAETARATLNADGSGSIVAGSSDLQWSWQSCSQSEECVPFGTGSSISTDGAAAGTVFKATASDGSTVTSPVWHGVVSAATPPFVSGRVQANALVTPKFGTWNGGWTGDFDKTQLSACERADGTECTTITNPEYVGRCPEGAAVIDPVFTG
jgi:hypothetical protein